MLTRIMGGRIELVGKSAGVDGLLRDDMVR